MRGAKRHHLSSLTVWLCVVCCLMFVALPAAQGLTNSRRQKDMQLSPAEVLEVERRLGELGYWAGEADGT